MPAATCSDRVAAPTPRGRALQLVLRNAGGDVPGETDMSTQGQSGKFTFCIAENEAENPWQPFHVEHGYRPEESTVSVIGASAGHNVFTYGCETGAEILDHFVGAMTALGHNNVIFPTGPVIVLGPEHAGVLARDGYNKDSIRQHLFRHARIPLSRLAARTARGLRHRRSRWFAQAGDPEHIGIADHPAHIHIVVAGGAGIHSQFVPTSFSYNPVDQAGALQGADIRARQKRGQSAAVSRAGITLAWRIEMSGAGS